MATGYRLPAIVLHWAVALLVFVMLALGLWMVDLAGQHPWYRRAPALHEATGIVVALLLLARIAWRWRHPPPPPLPGHRPAETFLAEVVHLLLYATLLAQVASGYLQATATGGTVDFFGWFEIPALVAGGDVLEDRAEEIHARIAWVLIGLVALHLAGALKHHLVDRDATLRRMLSTRSGRGRRTG